MLWGMDARVRELISEVAAKYGQPEEVAEANRRIREGAGLTAPEQTLVNFYYPFPCRVLDVGCGAGRVAIALGRQGHRVTGIDIAPPVIAAARRNAIEQGVRVDFKLTDGLKLDFADDSFDLVVVFSQTIEHLPGRASRVAFLREVARVLAPAGFLFLSAHDRYHPSMSALRPVFEVIEAPDAEEGDVRLSDVQGVQSKGWAFMHYSTPDELRGELTEAGFHVWQLARHSELGGEPELDRLFYVVCSHQPLDASA